MNVPPSSPTLRADVTVAVDEVARRAQLAQLGFVLASAPPEIDLTDRSTELASQILAEARSYAAADSIFGPEP